MSDQTTIIREIAEDVYKTLGSGFSEDVYDRAMQVGLRLAKIGYEGQKVVELKYKEHYVGEGYPDLVVHLGNEKLIVELKAISGEAAKEKTSNAVAPLFQDRLHPAQGQLFRRFQPKVFATI